MRTATSLTLVALGAILAFAVTAHPSFLNLHIAGAVIMLVGVAGLFLNRQGWLRRRIVLRRGAAGPVIGHIDETNFDPAYAAIDAGALQSVQPVPTGEYQGSPTIADVSADVNAAELPGEWVVTEQPVHSAPPVVAEEYIEE